MKLLFLIIISFFISPLDSLLKISGELEETKLIDSLISIGFKYENTDPDLATKFAYEALNRAQQKKYSQGIADSKYLLANIHLNTGNYEAVIDTLQMILPFYNRNNNKLRIAKTLKLLGDANLRLGDIENALLYYQQSKKIVESSSDKELENEYNTFYPHLLNSIGLVYRHTQQFQSALSFFNQALYTHNKVNNVDGQIAILNNIGLLYHDLDKFDSSLVYFKKAYLLAKDSNNERLLATASNNIGEAYHLSGKNNEAIKYLLEAYSIYNRYQDKNSILRTLFIISQINQQSGDYETALNNLEISRALAEEIGLKKELIPIYFQISLIYERLGKNTTALSYYKKYSEVKDLVFDLEKEQYLSQMQANLKLEEEKNKNHLNELQLDYKNTQLVIATIGIIILIIATIIIFSLYKIKQKSNKIVVQQKDEITKVNAELQIRNSQINEQNKSLKELNATKDKFFSIIAHDLKSPLGIIINISEYIINNSKNISNNETFELIERVKSSGYSLLTLLDNLLEWSKAQTGNIKFTPIKVDLRKTIFECIYLYKKQAAEKNITIHNNVKEKFEIIADKYMLEVIIRNLISNALKFTNENGNIHINAEINNSSIIASVEDDGIGIPPEIIPDLFDIGENVTRLGTKSEKGNGLGLILCKEFIEKHNGQILVESIVDKGTKVTFTLGNQNN